MKRTKQNLTTQMKKRTSKSVRTKKPKYDGNPNKVVSTGSTLLDLAISGGRIHGGGLMSGIVVEIAGPSSSGKTVLLSEIAGNIQALGGEALFNDPEARLSFQFAKIFGFDIDPKLYFTPDTVPEVFKHLYSWKPKNPKMINGLIADSFAALSTNMEMTKDEGDKMGGRRAKEFSEQLRKGCRIIKKTDLLLVGSNQLRQNIGQQFGEKFSSPGGEAIGFYSSVRLRTAVLKKIKQTLQFKGKEEERIDGIRIMVTVIKNSTWKPFRKAPVTVLYDYGIDDIRENLQFLKEHSSYNIYMIGNKKLDKSMDKAIELVEKHNLEEELKEKVIDLWEEIEAKFSEKYNRRKKRK